MNNKDYSLVLRACKANMSSRNGFVWPTTGPVECTDWNSIEECGNGLHGWLHGHGDGDVSNYWSAGSRWLVVKVKNKHIIDLDDKVKFKKGEVVFCGDRKDATDYILANDPIAFTKPVIGAFITTGDHGTSTSGYYGTSISGYHGTSTSGDYGISTSGYHGISTSGDYGTSTSGDYGISISGYHSTSASGKNGTSISGNRGTSTSGDCGTIIIKYYKNGRSYLKVGYIGEDSLEPNVAYKLDDNHNFVKA